MNKCFGGLIILLVLSACGGGGSNSSVLPVTVVDEVPSGDMPVDVAPEADCVPSVDVCNDNVAIDIDPNESNDPGTIIVPGIRLLHVVDEFGMRSFGMWAVDQFEFGLYKRLDRPGVVPSTSTYGFDDANAYTGELPLGEVYVVNPHDPFFQFRRYEYTYSGVIAGVHYIEGYETGTVDFIFEPDANYKAQFVMEVNGISPVVRQPDTDAAPWVQRPLEPWDVISLEGNVYQDNGIWRIDGEAVNYTIEGIFYGSDGNQLGGTLLFKPNLPIQTPAFMGAFETEKD